MNKAKTEYNKSITNLNYQIFKYGSKITNNDNLKIKRNL